MRPLVYETINMAKDLVGKRFNYLTVIKPDFYRHKGFYFYKWICRCDCGKELSIFQGELIRKNRLSCSRKCVKILENSAKNKVGKFCGKFYCKSLIKFNKNYNCSVYEFRCFCGKTLTNLWINTRNRISCGCIKTPNIKTKQFHQFLLNHKFGRLSVTECIYEKGETYVKCKCDCGKEKIIRGADIKKGTKSCGCLLRENMSIIGKIKGKDKGCYNHLLTEQDRIIQKNRHRTLNIELENWKNTIRYKFNNTCQICNLKNNNIHVHHISSWSTDIINRFDINNGIVLCKNCHNIFHKIYGKKDNNQIQLTEFKKLFENKQITNDFIKQKQMERKRKHHIKNGHKYRQNYRKNIIIKIINACIKHKSVIKENL